MATNDANPENGASTANARKATAAMLVAFALFAIFYSEGATRFARNLPGNALTDILVNTADAWHGLMDDLGPARLAPAVRDAFERLHGLSW